MHKKLDAIKLLVLDVDGVLTDGGLYVGSEENHDFKRFSIKDGLGLKLAMHAGLEVAIISGHRSEATRRRFSALGVEDVIVGAEDKRRPFADLLEKHGLSPENAAVMGDDLPDIPLLGVAGFAITVPDAPDEVKAVADHVTERHGGHGAVREVVELVLKAQGRWGRVMEHFTS